MPKHNLEITLQIANTSEGVLDYIADVRHRTAYLPSLKELNDIQGDPSSVGTTWRWRWSMLGQEFRGVGRCTEHERGRLYAFRTEGDLESSFTYQVEPEGDSTNLAIATDFVIPDSLLARLPDVDVLRHMARLEGEMVTLNLKAILGRGAIAGS